MAVIENIQSAELIEDRCELHFACAGFWNPQIMSEFLDLLNETCKPLVMARKPIYALGDFTDALPQDRETTALVRDHLENARHFGLKRVGVVGATALMKIQYKRVAANLDVAFFDSKVEALAWLRANR